MEKKLIEAESCNCKDPACCQPERRNRWHKIVFLAIVVFAAGIIAIKLFFSPGQEQAGNNGGCCADTTQCCDTSKNTDLK